jgi:hypothetical protein
MSEILQIEIEIHLQLFINNKTLCHSVSKKNNWWLFFVVKLNSVLFAERSRRRTTSFSLTMSKQSTEINSVGMFV